MDDEDSKIETEVAKYVAVPSSSSSVDGSESAKENIKSGRKKKTKKSTTTGDAVTDTIENPIEGGSDNHVTDKSGFKKVTLSLNDQKLLNCVVGQDLNLEVKWKSISKKELMSILEHLTSVDEVKNDLEKYSGENTMIACEDDYIPAADDLSWSFIVTVTDEALADAVKQQEMHAQENKEHLPVVVHKGSRPWKCLGSESEVNQGRASSTRPLIELEIGAKVEELMRPLNFQDRGPSYVSIGPGRSKLGGVTKLRIDCGAQAVPPLQNAVAQTDPGLPVNAWSQYIYDLENVQENIKETSGKELPSTYRFQQQDYLERALEYNETLNLYTNDYPLLVQREEDVQIPVPKSYESFEAFADVQHCTGKVVSSIVWHPMWMGMVAVAYVKTVRALLTTSIKSDTESIIEDVFRRNVILLWSLQDPLQPKLILLCTSEVNSIKWSPVNPNILVGACVSGQIVIWDIEGRLESMEVKEVMTRDQQRHRLLIRNLLSWSIQHESSKYLEPTAMSSLRFSHAGAAADIHWLTPYHRMGADGRYRSVHKGRYSMQFATCGEDGMVMIWDLDVVPEEARIEKKAMEREGKESLPTAFPKSRYSDLDRFMRPIYKLHPNIPDKSGMILTSMSLRTDIMEYKLGVGIVTELESRRRSTNSNADKIKTADEPFQRQIHVPNPSPTQKAPLQLMTLGFADGDVAQISWEGFDFDKGEEAVPCEAASVRGRGIAVHDGAVTSCITSPFLSHLILTIGGTVFALWDDSLPNEPFFWKACPTQITTGSWSLIRPSLIIIGRHDGSIEVWDFLHRSDKPILVQSISGEPLTAIENNNFGQQALAVADFCNALKLFHIPEQFGKCGSNDLTAMKTFIDREIQIRSNYAPWNKMFSLRNKEEISKKKTNLQEKQKPLVGDGPRDKRDAIKVEYGEKRRMTRRKRNKLAFLQNIANLQAKEENLLVSTLLDQKNLDKEQLLKEERPLILLSQMDVERAAKQKDKIDNVETSIRNTIASICPEIVEKEVDKRSSMEDLNAAVESEIAPFLMNYEEFASKTLSAIKSKQFSSKIDWQKSLTDGLERRAALDVSLYLENSREKRCLARKEERQANPPPQPSPLITPRVAKTPSLALSRETPNHEKP